MHIPQLATHSNHVTLWVSVIILWLVLNGNGMYYEYVLLAIVC